MSRSSHWEDLAKQISTSTSTLTRFFASNNLPEPSFDKDAPLNFPSSPEEIEVARRNLREATRELYQLATGPSEHIRWLSCWYHDVSAVRWIYHFNIAQIVPLEGDISFADIAKAANVTEGHTRRVLRQAMTNGIFCEPRVGFVAHTAPSAAIVRDKGTLNWLGYTMEESYPASVKLPETMEKYKGSEEQGHAPWNLAFKTDLPIFEYLAQQPARAQIFAETMTALTSSDGYNVRHILAAYPWDSLGHGTVVDVGFPSSSQTSANLSSRSEDLFGHASIALAEKFPDLKFVVQDFPDIVTAGASALPSSLKDRVTFQAHDFFTPQPVKDADVYFLRFILHDHSDKRSTLILKNLLPAFKPHTKLLVMDAVLPDPGAMPKSEERLVRIMDLEMMTNFNAKERSIEDWQTLFTQADLRLKIRSVNKPPASVNSVIEAVLEEEA